MERTFKCIFGVLAFALLPTSAEISDDFKFTPQDNGAIVLASNTTLRLAAKSGHVSPWDPIVFTPCVPRSRDFFKFEGGYIHAEKHPGVCLNAAGGLNAGTKIISYPCSLDGVVVDHEKFQMLSDGRIASMDGKMCFNVNEGHVAVGSEIVLWPCSSEPQPNEVFQFDSGRIVLKADPSFHLRVLLHGKHSVTETDDVVLWKTCEPAHHEAFEFLDNRIHLAFDSDLCLNAEGGLAAGNSIIIYECGDTPHDTEQFIYDEEVSIIFAARNPKLAFSSRGSKSEPEGLVLALLPDEEL